MRTPEIKHGEHNNNKNAYEKRVTHTKKSIGWRASVFGFLVHSKNNRSLPDMSRTFRGDLPECFWIFPGHVLEHFRDMPMIFPGNVQDTSKTCSRRNQEMSRTYEGLFLRSSSYLLSCLLFLPLLYDPSIYFSNVMSLFEAVSIIFSNFVKNSCFDNPGFISGRICIVTDLDLSLLGYLKKLFLGQSNPAL